MPAYDRKTNLTPRQIRVVMALMVSDSIASAARAAIVNEKTVRRWLEIPSFRDAMREHQKKALSSALGRLQSLSARAVETLSELLNAQSENARLAAAREILAQAVEANIRSDLEARVAQLERSRVG